MANPHGSFAVFRDTMANSAAQPIDLQARRFAYRHDEFATYLRWFHPLLWGTDLEWTLTQAGITELEYHSYAYGEWPSPTDPYTHNRIVIAFREARERIQRKRQQEKADLRNYWLDMAGTPLPKNVVALQDRRSSGDAS